jgi:hypothetical protein
MSHQFKCGFPKCTAVVHKPITNYCLFHSGRLYRRINHFNTLFQASVTQLERGSGPEFWQKFKVFKLFRMNQW